MMVELLGVEKRFGSKVLFSAISTTVAAGECLAVTGANGSGKTTLLKIIAGVVRPSAGTVAIKREGKLLDAEHRLPHLGMVSPEIALYDSLSGWENVSLLAGARGIDVREAEAARVCREVGLGEKGARLVKTYSTGMKQRLKFALLLATNATIWLLDEPSLSLDREGRDMVAGLIAGALSRRTAVVLATNDEAEVKYAHKTVALS